MRPVGPCLVVVLCALLASVPGTAVRAQGNDSQTEATAPGERSRGAGSVTVGAGTLGDATTGQSGPEATEGPHNPPDLLRRRAPERLRADADAESPAPPAVLAACDAIADPDRRAGCRSGRRP